MELHSRIPAPFAVHVRADDALSFHALWDGRREDLTAHLADLVLLGLLLGAPDGDLAVSAGPAPATVGEACDGQRPVGTWELSGTATATVLTGDGAVDLDPDRLGALAAAGLLRALADAVDA